MALKKGRGSGNAIEIPMSSMIDVVFLLLIYFIVTYHDEVPEAHLAVNLPSPSAPSEGPPPQLLELEVHPGEYFLRSKSLSLATIQKTLEGLAQASPDLTVIIKINQSARTKELIRLLDVCQGVGLRNLNVVTLE